MADETSPPEGAPTASNKRQRLPIKTLFSYGLWIAAIGLGIGCYWLRSSAEIDNDYKNVGTVITAGGAMVLVWCWVVFHSQLPVRLRARLFLWPLGLVAVLLAVLKFDGFSGDMVPQGVRFRWQATPDELLSLPAQQTAQGEDASQELKTTSLHNYPQFLGPLRRATITDVTLATDWQARPPRELWRMAVGAGWSAFSVTGDYAVTQEQRGEQEMVVCYALRTGKMLWSHADRGRFTSPLGGIGPRATATIFASNVYTQGALGQLNCLQLNNGQRLWTRNIIAENDAENIAWGRSGSPLVVDDLVIVSAGGPDGQSLVAYDNQTGIKVWSAGDDRASYASPVLARLGEVRQILSVNESTVTAHRFDDGKILWSHPWPGDSDGEANTSQPVVVGPKQVFLSKGYGQGSELLEVSRQQDDSFQVKSLWANPKVMKTKLTNVVVLGGHIYGLSGGILECIEVETGRRCWKRGRYGHGQVLLVESLLLVTSETGEVALVAARSDRYRELGRFKAIEGTTWNNPALVGNLLLVRNASEAACYELPLEKTDVPKSSEEEVRQPGEE